VGTGAVRPAFEPGLAQEVQRLRAAAELRAAGRFAEAATIYEALYDGRPAAELLLAAARTRAAGGGSTRTRWRISASWWRAGS
jgi:hypothetical protein